MNKKLSKCIEISKLLMSEKKTGRSFHMSFAFLKNKMVALAWNSYKDAHLTHVFGKYLPTRGGDNYKAGRHSECQLLKKLRIPTKDLTICNVRIDNNNRVAMAKCCPNCQKLLDSLGYRRILYSINEKEFGTIE